MNLDDLSVKEIKAIPNPDKNFIEQLKKDKRKSVQNYARVLENLIRKKELLSEKTKRLKDFDRQFYDNYELICGMDEVGRGPLAGPVLVAAVILPKESFIPGVMDSKKTTPKQRKELAEQIKQEALAYSYGVMGPKKIDKYNILVSTKVAMNAALRRLTKVPDLVLIDALHVNSGLNENPILHGDDLSYCIAASSIVAKIKRDAYMTEQAKIYPEYHFEKNMGYGTQEHIEAIKKYGLSPLHRRSFCEKFLRGWN